MEAYLSNFIVIEATDKKYGKEASDFIDRALKAYWG